jgi:hypothetical protein
MIWEQINDFINNDHQHISLPNMFVLSDVIATLLLQSAPVIVSALKRHAVQR